MNDDQLLQAALASAQGTVAGATPQQLERFEASLSIRLPAVLRRILLTTNGGDFGFGRFEATPFVPEPGTTTLQEVWERTPGVAPDESPPDNLLPICSDYGCGMYCLDLSDRSVSEYPVVFWSWDDGSIEADADSFRDFVAKSAEE